MLEFLSPAQPGEGFRLPEHPITLDNNEGVAFLAYPRHMVRRLLSPSLARNYGLQLDELSRQEYVVRTRVEARNKLRQPLVAKIAGENWPTALTLMGSSDGGSVHWKQGIIGGNVELLTEEAVGTYRRVYLINKTESGKVKVIGVVEPSVKGVVEKYLGNIREV